MFYRISALVLVACSWGLASGYVMHGSCPEFTPMNTFQIPPYLGRWFEVARFKNLFQLGQQCIAADYTNKSDGTVGVVNSGLDSTFKPVKIEGYAYPSNQTGHLYVKFPFPAPRGDYNVLFTDYETFSTVWACTTLVPGLLMEQDAWILSRETTLPAATIEFAKAKFSKWGIDLQYFQTTYQGSNCTYI